MAGLVVGLVIAVLVMAITVFAVKYLKSRRGGTEQVSDETPHDLNVHRLPDQFLSKNVGVLNLNGPTDNSSYKNPEVVTNEHLTIAESSVSTGNSEQSKRERQELGESV